MIIQESFEIVMARLDRQEQAIRILAEAIEGGSWHGTVKFIDQILHPGLPEISLD